MPYKRSYGKTGFQPRKIIKSFRDLEVYQKTFKASVEIMKKVIPKMQEDSLLRDRIIDSSLLIPNIIAEAHSHRFDNIETASSLLDQVMAESNKLVVYLEQARDIHEIDKALIEEIIKDGISARWKVLGLQRTWKNSHDKYEGKNQ